MELALNCAPAVSNDGATLYFGVSEGPVGTGSSGGYLVAVNSTTLAPVARIRLKDPLSGNDAFVTDVSSASPTVGPDGDVKYWRDAAGVHHVPKRALEEILLPLH